MGGRIVVFGDSSCFDDQLAGDSCLWLLPDILYYASLGEVSSLVAQHAVEIPQPFISKSIPPKRLPENQLHTVSRINQTTCSSVNYVRDTSYDPIQVLWQVSFNFFLFSVILRNLTNPFSHKFIFNKNT